jgi:hypothetical protein
MTITAFTSLQLSDQLEFLYAEGVYLNKRKTSEKTVILYQLNQSYIELFYLQYRCTVISILCSDNVDILNPYLEDIPIYKLFI